MPATPNRAPRPPGIWTIAGSLGRRQYWLFAALGLLSPLVLWSALSASGLIDPVFLPSPAMVARRVLTWLTEDDLLADTGISIYRVTAGFVLSAVLALPLGLLIGSFRPVAAMLEPLTDFIRYMPAVAFIPLIMLWVGIEWPRMCGARPKPRSRPPTPWVRPATKSSSWCCCRRPSRRCSTRCG
jgi:NitT/TauT family transport system permease protein